MQELIAGALARDKWSIGRLITLFEDPRDGAAERRREALVHLDASPQVRDGIYHGITGTPGAGKSSLIGELCLRLVNAPGQLSIAVVAVDPASEVSGGALLGDRTRVRFPHGEKRLFFRSQSSDRALGGVSRTTYQVCRLLGRLFDHVIVETVGIGQSEIEVQYVADRIYLVLQPLGGDQVQFMKAGIMETPDVFVLNKADEAEAAERSYHSLKASLSFTRPGEEDQLRILRTSAKTGLGLDELATELRTTNRARARHSRSDKQTYFFVRWVRDEFGRRGLMRLVQWMGAAEVPAAAARFVSEHGGFDQAQTVFTERMLGALA